MYRHCCRIKLIKYVLVKFIEKGEYLMTLYQKNNSLEDKC